MTRRRTSGPGREMPRPASSVVDVAAALGRIVSRSSSPFPLSLSPSVCPTDDLGFRSFLSRAFVLAVPGEAPRVLLLNVRQGSIALA